MYILAAAIAGFVRKAMVRQTVIHGRGGRAFASGLMSTDIKESDQGYELIVDMPSVTRENLSAELKDGYLRINATFGQTSNSDAQNEKYLRRERFTGSCRRSFYVGDKVKQEDIRAKFENGTLHLFIPKQSKQEQIEQKNLIAIEG